MIASGTLFLSLLGMPLHTLLFQVETENPPLLPTDLSFSFFCLHQTHH